jgi:hypothetical protein
VEIIECRSWQEFREKVMDLESSWTPNWLQIHGSARSKFLYRGHADAEWSLTTTLERFNPGLTSTIDYFRAINSARPQIEAHTGISYRSGVPTLQAYAEWAQDSDLVALTKFSNQAYEYKAYLRHHGCPSPLLDWTRSPYVAAFFAFRARQPTAAKVAIYVYCEFVSDVKHSSSDKPSIIGLGPYVSTHARHFLQQCEYTVCLQFDTQRVEWLYSPHESVFAHTSDTQDRLWKFILPSSERDAVLNELDRFNLNAYSLFGSEDSLVETVAMRHLKRKS